MIPTASAKSPTDRFFLASSIVEIDNDHQITSLSSARASVAWCRSARMTVMRRAIAAPEGEDHHADEGEWRPGVRREDVERENEGGERRRDPCGDDDGGDQRKARSRTRRRPEPSR